MISLIKKIKKHGARQSLFIFRRKLSKIYNLTALKLGRYDFSNSEHLLNSVFSKLVEYLGNKSNSILKTDLSITGNAFEGNNFFLLGKNYSFKDKINWHFKSFNSEESYSYIYSSAINVMDFKKNGDYRITWELNRHHHFVWLAQRYHITKNLYYKSRITDELNDWISGNNTGYGINFVSPMEIAIRLINWFVAIIIVYKTSNEVILNKNTINSLLSQLIYLNDNLFLKRKFRNNHSIVELAGLILFQSIIKWERVSVLKELYESLFSELNQQFYDDGINFEHSPAYTRFTLESLLIILIFVKDRETEKQHIKLYQLTKKYISSLRKFVTPKNTVPLFSDCDNGRILFLSGNNKDFNDFKGFFDFCGLFFNENDFLISRSEKGFNEETKWWCYLAETDISNPRILNEKIEPHVFPQGGYYIFKSPYIFLAFKSGYPGNKNLDEEYGPHVHNDLLSFELYWNGEPLLTDSGTFTYDISDSGYRDYFRSVYAHNTIVVNGQNHFENHESFGARNFPQVNVFYINRKRIRGEIAFNSGLNIKREIEIEDIRVNFLDSINGLNSESNVEINLNFHPSVVINRIDNYKKVIEIKSGCNRYIIDIDSNGHDFKIENKKGWYSDNYNCKTENDKLILSFTNIKNDFCIKWNITNCSVE